MRQSMRMSALRVGLLSAIGASALWLVTFGSFEPPPARLSAPGGYPLPDFRLPILNAPLLEGDTTFLESADIRGQVALVTFWASWCAPCIAEQPSLLALEQEFGSRGLRVFGVLHEDSPEVALEWLQSNDRLELKSVVGSPQFERESRGGLLPQTLLVDRSGQVTEVFVGYWPEREAYLRERVEALLAS